MLSEMAAKGTAADRCAAISTQLASHEAFPYRLHLLGDLLHLASRKSAARRKAEEALVELYTEKLLPPDRKLLAFVAHSLASLPDEGTEERKSTLFYWYVEDQLKLRFGKFVDHLRESCSDTVESVKAVALKAAFTLLGKVPEEERAMLTLLVNKLGDLIPRIASRAGHLLLLLLKDHPNMRRVAVSEIQGFIFRKNNPVRAQYYACTVLSQIMLSRGDAELPRKLLEIYFALFSAVTEQGEVEHRVMSTLLTGIRRAFPFSRHNAADMEKFYTPLFTIAAVSAFHHRVSALHIIHQLLERGEDSLKDRFYNSVYLLLMASPASTQSIPSSRLALFFSLLYKAVRAEGAAPRAVALVHRLLQVCLLQRPPYICGALFLVSEVLSEAPQLARHLRPSLGAPVRGPPPPALPPAAVEDRERNEDDDSDDDGFVTLPSVKKAAGTTTGKKKKKQPAPPPPKPKVEAVEEYDPRARNPLGAHAEGEMLWVICSLSQHFHPSVAAFASHVREAVRITYAGDPLEDFKLSAFLDAFSFKRPKKKVAQAIATGVALKRQVPRRVAKTWDGDHFADLPPSKVDIQDAFFHKYFTGRRARLLEMQKGSEPEADTGDKDGAEEEVEEDEEDEEEEEAEMEEDEEEEVEEAKEVQVKEEKKKREKKGWLDQVCKFNYDDMTGDTNVLADYRQELRGATDEFIDQEDAVREVDAGEDPLDDVDFNPEPLKDGGDEGDEGEDDEGEEGEEEEGEEEEE
eukprot:Hpha_TRINITY_DN16797_c5_g2::TRINITY_DN16797_c5_g2_i2::g.79030::m.79030/K14832/MAK21, NOC1, CEBPZ; ribosome biogenesis protein MAK21